MSDDSARRDPLSATPATEGWTPSAEAAGLTVQRYRILGPIGIGGMGVVYRAEDTVLGRAVALKFLPPTLTPNPKAKARFLDEARAASALDHPNVCTIYEVGETAEGQLFLALAFYEGETLRERLRRGPLPLADVLQIALQTARGLAKAHRQGVVHRDIKPANLMITEDGIVKILDFGIARLPSQAGPGSGPLLGTPGYMSPEQERGEAVDARSDVWSLGVVLREMLDGRRTEAIDRVLPRLLAADPAARYPDAGALLDDLADLVRESDGHSRPGWRSWAIALALLAAALAVWLLWGRGKAEPVPTFTRLTDLPGKEWFPSLAPDGDLFVYAKKVGDRSHLFLQPVGSDLARKELFPESLVGDSQPAFAPDGQRIAFRSEREGGGLFLTGLMGESVRRITDFGFNPAWSPDGRELVFATEGVENPRVRRRPSGIYRVDLASGRSRRIPTGDAVQPSWSPHGDRIAYWSRSSSGQRVIWTSPARGGKAVPVTTGESVDWNPVWSPDGRHLYFTSDRSGVSSLWRVPIEERSGRVLGKPEPVTTSGQAMLFGFSRDGRQLAYTSDETRTLLEKLAFDPVGGTVTGQATAITQTADLILSLDASRDGRSIVYQTSQPQEDLFLLQTDGTGRRQLTDDPFKDRLPRWSPDGTRIAFYSNRGGRYEIWTIQADGSRLERAAEFPNRQAYHPIWSPDGRWLACDLGDNEALIDMTRPAAERRPLFFPRAAGGTGFSASSWSADGRWLAGGLHTADEQRIPGIVLYSLAERRYVRLTDQGDSPAWLSDSRRLLYRDGDRLLFLDTAKRTSRPVLTIPPGSDVNDFGFGPGDRVLYIARNDEQGDIWLRTVK